MKVATPQGVSHLGIRLRPAPFVSGTRHAGGGGAHRKSGTGKSMTEVAAQRKNAGTLAPHAMRPPALPCSGPWYITGSPLVATKAMIRPMDGRFAIFL